ncbi:hypothetical protein SO802_031952 [Lithocarpus litseifolius]|uniref:DUF4283 domain-containing protein n=1 Tax=Lithocarpus litseifolius TaxID=425828 RepID=A0AAW2BLP8_9ROSI
MLCLYPNGPIRVDDPMSCKPKVILGYDRNMKEPNLCIGIFIDEVSDTEVEELSKGMVEVSLSKETKARIRACWFKALLVKVHGRIVGFDYLTFNINTLWNPRAKMDCVELGKDYFFIKFSDKEDYDKVLRGGPWFANEHFLAINPWEPYFKASEAQFS